MLFGILPARNKEGYVVRALASLLLTARSNSASMFQLLSRALWNFLQFLCNV